MTDKFIIDNEDTLLRYNLCVPAEFVRLSIECDDINTYKDYKNLLAYLKDYNVYAEMVLLDFSFLFQPNKCWGFQPYILNGVAYLGRASLPLLNYETYIQDEKVESLHIAIKNIHQESILPFLILKTHIQPKDLHTYITSLAATEKVRKITLESILRKSDKEESPVLPSKEQEEVVYPGIKVGFDSFDLVNKLYDIFEFQVSETLSISYKTQDGSKVGIKSKEVNFDSIIRAVTYLTFHLIKYDRLRPEHQRLLDIKQDEEK